MNKGDAQPGVHEQNTQRTPKTAVHEQNADFAFRTVRYSDTQGLERFRTFAEQLYEKRGGSLRAELVISFALRRKGGGTLPRDFIRFSRCQF